jgi:hypothetical protein
MKISKPAGSLLILLPLLTLVLNPSFSIAKGATFGSLDSESILNNSDTSDILSTLEQKEEQNWSTYEDPIMEIQFRYPTWWEN